MSLTIIKRELQSYFSTWNGYVIAALALLLEGLLFNAFAIGNSAKFSADVMADFFYLASGVTMVASLFLAIRLFAEEKSSGTLILLYTSSLSEREIVYGKFISALVYLAVMHLLSLYMPILILVHGKISFGHLAVGYLALSLIGAATIAMTLLCSLLAPNQLLAGISAAGLLVFMLILWLLAKIVEEPFTSLFAYLAFHNEHFTTLSRGVLHSKHVIYYFSVCIFFLECSVRALQIKRWQG
ncbi:MAG: ABC transporter permease subunit [Pseudomonadota bacterium]|nr:ABC transporter permease subunit [Pseudomonadota bacterium]